MGTLFDDLLMPAPQPGQRGGLFDDLLPEHGGNWWSRYPDAKEADLRRMRAPAGNWWGALPDATEADLRRPRAPAAAPKPPDPTEGMSTADKLRAGAGKFLVDTVLGLKQNLFDEPAAVLERMFPWSASASRLLGGKTAQEILAESRADAAERKRRDAPLMGTTAGAAGHAVATGLTLPLLLPLGPVAGGMAAGAAMPTTQDGEAARNVLIGGAAGFAGDKLIRGAARVVQPAVNPQGRAMLEAGITPTPGQILGGNFARAEAAAVQAPILGPAVAAALRRAGVDVGEVAASPVLSRLVLMALAPKVSAGLAATARLYGPRASQVVAALLAQRPAAAGLLSEGIRAGAPTAGLLSADAAVQATR